MTAGKDTLSWLKREHPELYAKLANQPRDSIKDYKSAKLKRKRPKGSA